MTGTAITPDQFEKAVARACLRRVTRLDRVDMLVHGDAVAVRYGAFTAEIATEAKLAVHTARRMLLSLYNDGKVIREDSAGGRTAWWPVGLAASQVLAPPAVAPSLPVMAAPARQAFTTPAPTQRQHWSTVLGIARDSSTSEAREGFTRALGAINELEPDAEQQRQRIRDAYSARLSEDGISEYE